MKRWIAATLLALCLVSAFAAATLAGSEPCNRVVVILDASASYEGRRQAAIGAITALLDSMARRPKHRWEHSRDTISVVSLDALPEVIWQGTLDDLRSATRADWQRRFDARRDFSRCTDVGAGFRLAARLLAGDPRIVHKYLFAFTDLVNEPPAGSGLTCVPARRPSPAPADFPWSALRDASTSVFWVPVDQKMAWSRSVAEQGLEADFHLYSISESDAAVVQPPPVAQAVVTDDDRVETRRQVAAAGLGLLRGLGWVLLACGALVVLLLVAAQVASRQRPRVAARVVARRPHTDVANRPARPGAR
jgi:hypothetical protein